MSTIVKQNLTAATQPAASIAPVAEQPAVAVASSAPTSSTTIVMPSHDPATTTAPPSLPVHESVMHKLEGKITSIESEVSQTLLSAKTVAVKQVGVVTDAFEEAVALIFASLNSPAAGTAQAAPTATGTAVASPGGDATDATHPANLLAMSEIIVTIINNCKKATGATPDPTTLVATANAPSLIHRLAIGAAIKQVLGVDVSMAKVHAIAQAILQAAANAAPALVSRVLSEMAAVGL